MTAPIELERMVVVERERPPTSSSDATTVDSARGLEEDAENAILLNVTTTSDDGRTQPLLNSNARKSKQYSSSYILGFILANWYKFVVLGLIITMIVLVSIFGFSVFGTILGWFKRRNGWGGWGVFIGFYTCIVALFIPGVIFITGAGYIFGFWRGLLAVWIGGAVGQALAFLLARYLLQDWVENFVRSKWKKWKYIDAAIEQEGWKLVLVLRLSPIIPYNLLNIAMATTSMHFWSFTVVSAIGIVFECAVFCYLGTMADSISSIAQGHGTPKAIQWVMLGVSIFMCVIGAIFVSVMVRRAIQKAEEAGASVTDLAAMAEQQESETEELLANVSPISLEREGHVKPPLPGLSRLAEASQTIFNLQSAVSIPGKPESRGAMAPGTLSIHLRTPSGKAKTSPRAGDALVGTPFSHNKVSDVQRDVELGGGHTLRPPRSAKRRASSTSRSITEGKAESDDEGGV